MASRVGQAFLGSGDASPGGEAPEGCVLAGINSAHHQAILKVGQGLRPTAWSAEDNVIECVELEDYPFGLGVQWHPEYLQGEPFHKSIFEALMAASLEDRATRLAARP